MRNKLSAIFSLMLLLSGSNICSMQIFKKLSALWERVSDDASNHDVDTAQDNKDLLIITKDEGVKNVSVDKALLVMTKDGYVKNLSADVVQYCERLKLAHYFWNHKRDQLRIRFTKKELDTFVTAFQNSSSIDYDKDLFTIMKVSESFGAYILYAYCVSGFLSCKGVQDIDCEKICPLFNQLMDNKINQKFLLYKMMRLSGKVQALSSQVIRCKEKDYYIEIDTKAQGGTGYYHQAIFSNDGEKIHCFKGSNTLYMKFNTVYCFKKQNVVLYFEHTDSGRKLILYDVDLRKTIASLLPIEMIAISSDEKYIAGMSPNRGGGLVVYSIEDLDSIKYKQLKYEGQKFYSHLMFCADNKKIAAELVRYADNGYSRIDAELGLWNLSDFEWDVSIEGIAPSYEKLIGLQSEYIGELCCSGNGTFLYCQWGPDAHFFEEMIDCEKQKSVHFPDKRNFSDYTIFPNDTNLLINKKSAEIYDINDVSKPLYQDAVKNLKYTSFWSSHIVYEQGEDDSYVLKYDKNNNSIIENTLMKGKVQSLNRDSLILSMITKIKYENGSTGCCWSGSGYPKIYLYDKSEKMKLYDVHKDGCKVYNPRFKRDSVQFFVNNDPSNLCITFDLYTQEEKKYCQELCKNMTCAQYVFLDTLCFVADRDQQKTAHAKQKTVLSEILNTFPVESQGLIKNKLRLSIQAETEKQ